jgi:hypothetical protein
MNLTAAFSSRTQAAATPGFCALSRCTQHRRIFWGRSPGDGGHAPGGPWGSRQACATPGPAEANLQGH